MGSIIQLPLGLTARASIGVLKFASKVGGVAAEAAPWVAAGAIATDIYQNRQLNAGHVYQAAITGLSLIPGAGLIIGGGALLAEGISYYYTGRSVSDNINYSLNGGVIIGSKH